MLWTTQAGICTDPHHHMVLWVPGQALQMSYVPALQVHWEMSVAAWGEVMNRPGHLWQGTSDPPGEYVPLVQFLHRLVFATKPWP